jgi:hypothetical protein
MANFRETAMHNVQGWLGDKAVDALELACEYHQQLGIRGDAFEIGVYHGRFFLALMAAIEPDEIAVAADIFDDQILNIDRSGTGEETFRIFKENVDRFAANAPALRILAGDSMNLRTCDVLALSTANGFRLISVDGGHTAEHVMNDLGLASELILGGGAIFLDDFHSPHWPGVTEGYARFMMHANRNLAPVLHADNKLVMTTISHQPQMLDLMRQRFVPREGRYMAEVASFGFRYIASN